MKPLSFLKNRDVLIAAFVAPLAGLTAITALLNTRFEILREGYTWSRTWFHTFFGCNPVFADFQTAIANRRGYIFFAFIGFIFSGSLSAIFTQMARRQKILLVGVLTCIMANLADLGLPAMRSVDGELEIVPVIVRTCLWIAITFLLIRFRQIPRE